MAKFYDSLLVTENIEAIGGGLKINSTSGAISYLAENTAIGHTLPTSRLHVKGSGNTSSTTALLVENNTEQLITVLDDGSFALGIGSVSSSDEDVIIGKNSASSSGPKNSGFISIGNNSQSGTLTIGANSISIGTNTTNTNTDSMSIGNNSSSGGLRSLAIGTSAHAQTSAQDSVAIGPSAKVTQSFAIAIGSSAEANFEDAISIGTGATGVGLAMGNGATTDNGNSLSVAIGSTAEAETNAVAIGSNSFAGAASAVGIGISADASGGNSVAIGSNPVADTVDSIAIGFFAGNTTGTKGTRYISIGQNSNIGTSNVGADSIALGRSTKSIGQNSFSVGLNAGNTTGTVGTSYISIGVSSNQGTSDIGTNSLAVGSSAKSIGGNSVSIGTSSGNTTGTVSATAISIGFQANQGTSDIGSNSIAIGTNTETTALSGIAIGNSATVTGSQSMAIGVSSQAPGVSATAVGIASQANGTGAVAVGNARAFTAGSVAVGSSAGASTGTTGDRYVAVGNAAGSGSFDIGTQAVMVGASSKATGSGQISIGENAGNTTGSGGFQSITLGSSANQGTSDIGNGSIAMGRDTESSGLYSIAIGNETVASAGGAIMIGGHSSSIENDTANSVAFGWGGSVPQIRFASGASDKSFINSPAGFVIGEDGSNGNVDAILELNSSSKGLLLPRINNPSANVSTPVNGMMAYDSTDDELQAYIGGAWVLVGSTSGQSAGSEISGLTDNFIPKSNTTGDNIEDSRLEDSGTALGIGSNYNLTRNGETVLANGSLSNNGDAQSSEMIARGQTTDATQTEIFLDGVSEKMTLVSDSLAFFTVDIVAIQSNGSNATSARKFERIIKNIGGTTSLVSSATETLIDEDAGATGWSVSVDADDTNDSLRIRVTGEASKNINWVARVKLTESRF